jgi:general secretion pathway protein N
VNGGPLLLAFLVACLIAGSPASLIAQEADSLPVEPLPADVSPDDTPLPEVSTVDIAPPDAPAVDSPPAADVTAAPPPNSPNPLADLDLESLTATRQLPLFTPSRSAPVVETSVEPEPEPVVSEPEAPVETPSEPPPLRLIGVVMTASEQVAILSNEGTGEVQRLRPGETYESWTLRIVDTRTVAFENGDQSHTFKMFEPGSQPGFVPGAKTPSPEEAFSQEGTERPRRSARPDRRIRSDDGPASFGPEWRNAAAGIRVLPRGRTSGGNWGQRHS